MKFTFNDGGRKSSGLKGSSRDCVCRSISIVTGFSYLKVYEDLIRVCAEERLTKRNPSRSHPRTGVARKTYEKFLLSHGYVFVPTMGIGTGCKVHLKDDELPRERLIVRLSSHLTAFLYDTIHDTHDPSREGTRCVYGYYLRK